MQRVEASFRAYQLALTLFDKHVNLPTATNVHYKNDAIYDGMFYLSLNNTYAETAMEDLRVKHHVDAPTGTQFLNRLKKLFSIPKKDRDRSYEERVATELKIWKKLTDLNDELLSKANKYGLFKKPVVCAIDYTLIPYYGISTPAS